jgi:endonuclease YncB( thermonuclease family)
MQKLLLLFVLFTNTLILSAQISGKVTKVADGDTFTLLDAYGKVYKIRVYGIDCPELSQPFGKDAKRFTAGLILNQTVFIEKISKDRNGRVVAKVYYNNRQSLNEELLRKGMAWHFTKYDKSASYAALERQAKASKVGLWAFASPMAPWDWRRRK